MVASTWQVLKLSCDVHQMNEISKFLLHDATLTTIER